MTMVLVTLPCVLFDLIDIYEICLKEIFLLLALLFPHLVQSDVAALTPVSRSALSCDDLRSGAQASGYTQAMELCVETLFQCLPLEKLLMSQ